MGRHRAHPRDARAPFHPAGSNEQHLFRVPSTSSSDQAGARIGRARQTQRRAPARIHRPGACELAATDLLAHPGLERPGRAQPGRRFYIRTPRPRYRRSVHPEDPGQGVTGTARTSARHRHSPRRSEGSGGTLYRRSDRDRGVNRPDDPLRCVHRPRSAVGA
jgi:hypothetical protein